MEPTGDSVEPTGDERVAEESGPLTFEQDALANFVAVVIAHTRATAADVGVRDAQLNRLLDAWGIGNIDEFNVQVGKHLEDLEAADEISGRQSAGWGPSSRLWDFFAGIAWGALLSWALVQLLNW